MSFENFSYITCVPPTASDLKVFVIGGQFVRVIPNDVSFQLVQGSGLTGKLKVYSDGTYDIGLRDDGMIRYTISRACEETNQVISSDTLSFTYSELLQRTIDLDSSDADSIIYLSHGISTQQSVSETLGLSFIDSVLLNPGFEVIDEGSLQIQKIEQ